MPPGDHGVDHGGDREGGGSTVNRSYYVTYNQMIKEYKIVSSTTHDTETVSTDTRTVTDRLKGGGDDDMAYMLFFRAKAGE